MDLGVVLGSAAIGAVVSTGITMFGQYLERRSRREELILTKAIEMAHFRVEFVMKAGTRGKILPEIKMAEMYHQYLKSVLETGKLPADFELIDD